MFFVLYFNQLFKHMTKLFKKLLDRGKTTFLLNLGPKPPIPTSLYASMVLFSNGEYMEEVY